MHKIICSPHNGNSTLCFPAWTHFLSYLTALARTSSTMLNRSGESGQPCLVPDLRGKSFHLSPWTGTLAAGSPHVACTVLRYIPATADLSRICVM